MQAFIDWIKSNEPCTPRQAAIVCAVVFGGMILELVLIARMCANNND